MDELSTEFLELFKRVEAHEIFVQAEIRRVETAMTKAGRAMQHRIDKLDDRMDAFVEKHGGPDDAQVGADDAAGPDR